MSQQLVTLLESFAADIRNSFQKCNNLFKSLSQKPFQSKKNKYYNQSILVIYTFIYFER